MSLCKIAAHPVPRSRTPPLLRQGRASETLPTLGQPSAAPLSAHTLRRPSALLHYPTPTRGGGSIIENDKHELPPAREWPASFGTHCRPSVAVCLPGIVPLQKIENLPLFLRSNELFWMKCGFVLVLSLIMSYICSMAVVQYTAIVNQLRGKLNGSVFNRSSSGYTLSSKGQPPATITHEQSLSRSRFQQAQQRWKTLGQPNQQAWALFAANNPNRDRFGNEAILSGYNKYMECTVNVALFGSNINYPINTDPVPPAPFSSLGITNLILRTYIDGSQSFQVFYSVTDPVSAVKHITFEVGLPMSPGQTVYNKSYRYMGMVIASGAGTSGDIQGRLLPPSWVYRPGDRVPVRVRYYIPFRGVIGYETVAYVSLAGVPSITSWTSDKYSGSGPYRFTIGLFNKSLLNGTDYRLEFREQETLGVCPVTPLGGSSVAGVVSVLLSQGYITAEGSVPAGYCSTLEVRIVRVSDNAIIDLQFFNINNI